MKQNNQYTVCAQEITGQRGAGEKFTGLVYASNAAEANVEADKWVVSLAAEKSIKLALRSVDRNLKTSTKSTYRPSRHF